MTTLINLIVNYEPSYAEVSVAMDRYDGGIARITAIVDTGARTSLFPSYLLDLIPHHVLRRIEIEQAGIALQVFEGIEARITLWLEDRQGNRTAPLHAVV